MPKCSCCNKWGIFLKLVDGRCRSCHESFTFHVKEFENLRRILLDCLDIIQKTKSLETLRSRSDLFKATHAKIVELNNKYHIVDPSNIPAIDKALSTFKLCENKLLQAEKEREKYPYRRNWDVPLNEQFHTQNTSHSYEEAKKHDYEFCKKFLQKVRNEAQGHPELNTQRYPVPRPILSLRSPNASSLRDMLNYPYFPNLSFLDDAEYMYVFLAHSQAGRRNTPDSGYDMNGFMRSFFPDHTRAMKILFDLGFFIAPDIYHSLHAMTIPQLRAILKDHGISAPSKSRKADLVHIIVDQVDNTFLDPIIQSNAILELSDFGYGMVHSLYSDAGFHTQLKTKETEEERFERRKREVLDELREYRENKWEYFVSDCVLDMKTCSTCGERDLVPTRVSDAIIGVNAPPYHIGCRCGIMAHFDDTSHDKRSARDPDTNKSYLTTAKTYSEWMQRIRDGKR